MNKLVVAALVVLSFLLGYGVISSAFPLYGRSAYYGYFLNRYDDQGTYVLPNSYSGNAFPASINNAGAFTNFILNDLGGSAQQKTGASFIIQTMIGSSRNRPPSGAEQTAWVNLVNQYAAAGRISWTANYCHNVNSFYQRTGSGVNPDDDAFYSNSGCAPTIVFTAPSGQQYGIRRQCANPVGNGSIGPLPTLSNWSMSGSSSVNNPSPKPGQQITFSHSVHDNGPTNTNQDIWFAILSWPSGATIQGGQNSGPYNAGETKSVNSNVVTVPAGTPAGTQICQNVLYDWANSAGGRNGTSGPACATVAPDWALVPNITISQGASPLPSGSYIEPGTSVTFNYAVSNSSAGDGTGIACNMYANNHAGFFAIPAPAESSGPAPSGPACTSTFPHNANTSLGTETIASAPTDTSICRSLYVNPATPGGGPVGYEVCVYVANKPYARVYGGDITAGNGQPGNCALTVNAAIVGWNKEAGGGYGGAGVQYAALALDSIYDFATNLGNAGSGVTTPSGLAFANTTASGASTFGGKIGSFNSSCIPDYYGTPTGPSPGNNVNVGTLASGNYTATGPLTIVASSLAAGKKVSIFVSGNVIITGNIGYSGASDSTHIPLFELVATGNIYIDSGVTNLDGVYIAQSLAAGTIYTCATGAAAIAPTSPAYFNTCKNRLVVNGAFVARQVQLLRTNGTLNGAAAGDPNSSANTGEVFNYGPAFWIPQPASTTAGTNYDSVTSLPPIL